MPCCKLAYGETFETKNKERPLAKTQQGAEAFSLTVHKELNHACKLLSLEMTIASGQHLDHSLQETQLSPLRNLETLVPKYLGGSRSP